MGIGCAGGSMDLHQGRRSDAAWRQRFDREGARPAPGEPDRSPPAKPFDGLAGAREPCTLTAADLVEEMRVKTAPLPFRSETAIVPVDDERPAKPSRVRDDSGAQLPRLRPIEIPPATEEQRRVHDG